MKYPIKIVSTRWLVLYALVCTSNYSYIDAAILGRAATIFGFGATPSDESSNQQEQQDTRIASRGPMFSDRPHPPPPKGYANIPPPPPPPNVSGINTHAHVISDDDSLENQTQIANTVDHFPGHYHQQEQHQQQHPPRSPADNVLLQHPSHASNLPGRMPFHPQGRGNGPPFQPPNYILLGMQHDLEVAFQREHGLRAHLSNVTTQLAHMQQREDLHVRQLDVLTERVIETEAAMAKERNELLQYKSNCTEMGKQIALLEGSVEEWRQKCSEHVEQVARLRNESEALGKKLERMTIKAEDLSILVERHRIAEQDDELTTASFQRRKSAKKRGFFAWMFGWGVKVDPVDESLETLREDARATLLTALQRERETVEELENAVTHLQRNNSALAEQVKSRDDILEELNDRIGVFEEDRVVLKAALRQLKKDMSEEAPKTQRIADELQSARVEIDRLQKEIESLVISHEEEISHLQTTIQVKQDALQLAESNLTMIGTYVRKLEERLGDFAVARREIENREQKCLDIENDAEEGRRSRQLLEDQIESLQKEHQEFRELIEELIQARSRLKLESDQLRNERDAMKQAQSQLAFNVRELKEMISSLQDENSALSSQYFSLKQEYNATKGTLAEVQRQSVVSEDFETMAQKLKSLQDIKENLEAQLENLQQEKQTSLQNVQSAYSALQSTEDKLLQLQNTLSSLKDTNERERESLQEDIQRTVNLLNQAEEKVARLEKELNDSRRNEEALLNKIEAVQKSAKANTTGHSEGTSRPQERSSEAAIAAKNLANFTKSDAATNKEEKHKVKQVDPSRERQVPLRNVRKTFSKLTGVHGFITKPSRPSTRKSPRFRPERSQLQKPKVAAPQRSFFNQSLQALHNATNTNSTKAQRPFSVPTGASTFPVGVTNATRAKSPSRTERKIPFRSLRKFSSKITGVHGLFSRPSSPRQKPGRPSISGKPQTSPEKRVSFVPNGKSQTSESQASMPVSLRPELFKNSIEDIRKSQPTTQSNERQASNVPVSLRPVLFKNSEEDIRKSESATQSSETHAGMPASLRPELPQHSAEDTRKFHSATIDTK